jgi:cytochrome P450
MTVATFDPPHVEACIASAEYELFCAGRLDDPYPLLAWLRNHDPVHFSPTLDAWIVTRYEDVHAGLLDNRLANDRVSGVMSALPPALRESYAPLGEHVSNWLGFTDPPKHTRMRGLLRPVFSPAAARGLTSHIETIVDELLTMVDEAAEVDLIASLAFPLPARVICTVLGVPVEHAAAFHGWSDDMAGFTGNIGPTLVDIAPQAMESYKQLDAFMTTMVDERRRCPSGDLIGQLSAAEGAGELSRPELVGLSVFALVAGHETTASLIGTGLLALLRDEELRSRIGQDDQLVSAAVEEMLRLETPIQFSPRLTAEEVVICDRRIPKDTIVMLHMGAANRDPEVFPDPDQLRLDRQNSRHLSFAWGPHFCLGAPLARLEATLALPRVLNRFPDLQLMPVPQSWRESMAMRGLSELRAKRTGGSERASGA